MMVRVAHFADSVGTTSQKEHRVVELVHLTAVAEAVVAHFAMAGTGEVARLAGMAVVVTVASSGIAELSAGKLAGSEGSS